MGSLGGAAAEYAANDGEVTSPGNSEADFELLDVAYAIGFGFLSSTSTSLNEEVACATKNVDLNEPHETPQQSKGSTEGIDHERGNVTGRISKVDK